jgi:hypothetical protein
MILGLCLFGYAEVVPDQITGYHWDNGTRTHKLMVLGSFLKGYRSGVAAGATAAMSNMREGVITELQKTSLSDQERAKFRKVLQEIAIDSGMKALERGIWPSRDLVSEVDAFYQAFPLCKRLDLFGTFRDLLDVWQEKKSYKEVGEKCVELVR